MDTPGVIQLIIIALLILLSAFFASAEAALSNVNRTKLRVLEEEGNDRAKTINRILDRYGKLQTAILIINNIVKLTASSLTTILIIHIWDDAYIGLAIGILTLVILFLGEVIPRSRACCKAEKISLSHAYFVYFIIKLLTPLIWITDSISKGLLKLFRIDTSKKNDTITDIQFKNYVDVNHEDSDIEPEERKFIKNVFEFSDTCARDIMIPRTNMVTINSDSTTEELLQVFKESMYTRIPVYHEEKDSMLGFINIKDFFLAMDHVDDKSNFDLTTLIRDAYFTYEYKKTADLLLEMREKCMNLAFVLNEYGSTVGMITIEDLLEELVGEIRDEYDEDEEELIQKIDDRTYLIEGSMNLSDINEAIGTNLDSEDYDSIGGIIISQLDRLPTDKETVTLEDGTTLQVNGIDQNRILHVLMTLPPKEDTNEEDSDDDKKTEAVI